jgi:hypothetical protein
MPRGAVRAIPAACDHGGAVTRGDCLARIAVLALLGTGLAGCGGHGRPVPTREATAAYVAASPSILEGAPRHVTFAQARRAIARLYARSPRIRRYIFKNVSYTPAARDRVLAACRPSGPAKSSEAETARAFGCAPLILFVYSFGVRESAPEAIEVARKLFWYVAESGGSNAALPPLTDLLQRWGVR